jgi:hypothetical protein
MRSDTGEKRDKFLDITVKTDLRVAAVYQTEMAAHPKENMSCGLGSDFPKKENQKSIIEYLMCLNLKRRFKHLTFVHLVLSPIPPNLCLPSNWDYRPESLHPAVLIKFKIKNIFLGRKSLALLF